MTSVLFCSSFTHSLQNSFHLFRAFSKLHYIPHTQHLSFIHQQMTLSLNSLRTLKLMNENHVTLHHMICYDDDSVFITGTVSVSFISVTLIKDSNTSQYFVVVANHDWAILLPKPGNLLQTKLDPQNLSWSSPLLHNVTMRYSCCINAPDFSSWFNRLFKRFVNLL